MVKVAVLGAAGGIGQPLSLLLSSLPGITSLSLYDIVMAHGVAADLSHINSGVHVTGHVGKDELGAALQGCDIVVIPAGVPRKPGMTRDDLFNINAGIVRDLALGVAKNCPRAICCIISNPVNSTVPIFAEVLKRENCFDPRKVFGVTTLDAVRAATFLSQKTNGKVPVGTRITVLGGHSGHTIVPVFSPYSHGLSGDDWAALVNRVQFGGDEVVKAKDGAGSATLSMAYAAKRFVESVIHGLTGQGAGNTVESAYVCMEDDRLVGVEKVKGKVGGCSWFAVDVKLGKMGAEKVEEWSKLSEQEEALLAKAVEELKGSIQKGVEFVAQSKL